VFAALANYAAVAIEQARVGEQLLKETERDVSVMFTDIVAFTTRSEHMTPVEVSKLLNYFYTEMAEHIFEFDGTLDNFMRRRDPVDLRRAAAASGPRRPRDPGGDRDAGGAGGDEHELAVALTGDIGSRGAVSSPSSATSSTPVRASSPRFASPVRSSVRARRSTA
jgi:hypothetical protein